MKIMDIAVIRAVRSFAHAYLRPLTLVSSVAACVALAWGSPSAAAPTANALAENALSGGALALEASCERGDAVACNDLGVSYLRGYGLSVDLGLAIRAFESSCTNGSADGCGNLGALYESGTGVAPNSSAAASLYQQACDMGCALGCSNLGALYARGRGFERDLDAARSCSRSLARTAAPPAAATCSSSRRLAAEAASESSRAPLARPAGARGRAAAAPSIAPDLLLPAASEAYQDEYRHRRLVMNDSSRFEEHPIVSKAQWLEARKALLAREKELTRQRDALGAARRALPWVRVEEPYVFETVAGRRTLAQLFAGKSQLAVYHLMFAPEWEAACKSCSFWADTFNGITTHLAARDVTLTAVSRAPLAKLQAFTRRMGWTFPWASSFESRFNFDFGVSFTPDELATGEIAYNFGRHPAEGTDMPGISVFVKDASERVFHTYSCYARGIDAMNAAYQYLDLVPKGRDEDELDFSMAWVRHHDRYA